MTSFMRAVHSAGRRMALLLLTTLFSALAQSADKPRYTNHLIHEKSPYLLLHAHNPVNWYPWGPEAFAKAKAENKPIFLSVGYYTCHWCHVMERESYSNPAIGALINRNFIAIKVDREERPDVDAVYIRFLESTIGSAGWPMNVFLTPDLKPFFGGTYFPPTDRGGQYGLTSVLEHIASAWAQDHAKIVADAGKITAQLSQESGGEVGDQLAVVQPSVSQTAFEAFKGRFDAENGGFGGSPKFPRPVSLDFLLRYSEDKKSPEALAMALKTLDAMAKGGIYDQLGGGFHRYATDAQWQVPHFEKMLYDQSQLVQIYLDAYQITQDTKYADVAQQTLDFVLREMRSPEGGFYSALDADSPLPGNAAQSEEGAFYLWSGGGIESALKSKQQSALFDFRYGILQDGNVPPEQDVEGRLKGLNVLYQKHSAKETASHFNLPLATVERDLRADRVLLTVERSQRAHPPADSKVITVWNGMMISALARGSQILNQPSYEAAAIEAAQMLRTHVYAPSTGLLKRRYRNGSAEIDGFLSDYAGLTQGLLDLFEASSDAQWLSWALQLQKKQNAIFADANSGAYLTTENSDRDLLWKDHEAYDGAEPSANSVAAMNLIRIWQFTEEDAPRKRAAAIIDSFGGQLSKYPETMPAMVSAYAALTAQRNQIVIAGRRTDEGTKQMLSLVWHRFTPNSTLLLVSGGAEQMHLSRLLPLLANMHEIDGKATAYVCQNYTCHLPTTDLAVMTSLLEKQMQ